MLLAIDTSAGLCAAAVCNTTTGEIVAEKTVDIGRGHAEVLMTMVQDCIEDAAIHYTDLTGVAVTRGPGSFTGVRVGMAAARGFALGLSVPLTGVSTLEASAAMARELGFDGPLAVLLDARRNEAYCQIAGDAPFVAAYEILASRLASFEGALCGSGAPFLVDCLPTGITLETVHAAPAAPISAIARLAATLEPDPQTAGPLYLRSADAKPQAGAGIARLEG